MPVDNVLGDAELGREHAQAYAAHAQRLDASTVSMRTKSALCGAIWSFARHGLKTPSKLRELSSRYTTTGLSLLLMLAYYYLCNVQVCLIMSCGILACLSDELERSIAPRSRDEALERRFDEIAGRDGFS